MEQCDIYAMKRVYKVVAGTLPPGGERLPIGPDPMVAVAVAAAAAVVPTDAAAAVALPLFFLVLLCHLPRVALHKWRTCQRNPVSVELGIRDLLLYPKKDLLLGALATFPSFEFLKDRSILGQALDFLEQRAKIGDFIYTLFAAISLDKGDGSRCLGEFERSRGLFEDPLPM